MRDLRPARGLVIALGLWTRGDYIPGPVFLSRRTLSDRIFGMAKSELVDQSKRRFLKAGVLALTGGTVAALGFRPVTEEARRLVEKGKKFFVAEEGLTGVGETVGIRIDFGSHETNPTVWGRRFLAKCAGDKYEVSLINYLDAQGHDMRLANATRDAKGNFSDKRWRGVQSFELPFDEEGRVVAGTLMDAAKWPRSVRYLVAPRLTTLRMDISVDDEGERVNFFDALDGLVDQSSQTHRSSFQKVWEIHTSEREVVIFPTFLNQDCSFWLVGRVVPFVINQTTYRLDGYEILEIESKQLKRRLGCYVDGAGKPIVARESTTVALSTSQFHSKTAEQFRVAGSTGEVKVSSEFLLDSNSILERTIVSDFFGLPVHLKSELSSLDFMDILTAMYLDRGSVGPADFEVFKEMFEYYSQNDW